MAITWFQDTPDPPRYDESRQSTYKAMMYTLCIFTILTLAVDPS